MADTHSRIILNANQRRHFEVLFSRIEDSVARIDELLVSRPGLPRKLTVVDDDVPESFRHDAPPLLRRLRDEIAALSETIGLQATTVSRRRLIAATLTAQAVRVEDSLASQLRGYGPTDPTVASSLNPRLEGIARALSALANSLNDYSQSSS